MVCGNYLANFPRVWFFLLSKTILEGEWERSTKWKVGFANDFVVDCVGRSGGLILLWHEDWNVTIQSYSKGHIDTNAISPDGLYGNSKSADLRFS